MLGETVRDADRSITILLQNHRVWHEIPTKQMRVASACSHTSFQNRKSNSERVNIIDFFIPQPIAFQWHSATPPLNPNNPDSSLMNQLQMSICLVLRAHHLKKKHTPFIHKEIPIKSPKTLTVSVEFPWTLLTSVTLISKDPLKHVQDLAVTRFQSGQGYKGSFRTLDDHGPLCCPSLTNRQYIRRSQWHGPGPGQDVPSSLIWKGKKRRYQGGYQETDNNNTGSCRNM